MARWLDEGGAFCFAGCLECIRADQMVFQVEPPVHLLAAMPGASHRASFHYRGESLGSTHSEEWSIAHVGGFSPPGRDP